MKKILYSVLGLGALLATSCNMDIEPVGTILDSEAIESVDDCFMYRNSFYSNLRALSTGGYIYYTEMQMDGFLGTVINGNRIGALNSGTVLSSDSDIESIWAGCYGAISSVNFFMEKTDELLASGKITEEQDIKDIKYFVAEGKFSRAFFYFWLLNHYCPTYNDANKDKRYGLPLVNKYNPSLDKSTYPQRATLEETYKFIEDELAEALTEFIEYEKDDASAIAPMSPYLCSWTVKALQARIALMKGDWATAKRIADDIIDNGPYTLSTRDTYANMWTNDTNNEIIFRPFSSATEAGISSTGAGWNGASDYQSDYIPTPFVATPDDANTDELYLYRSRDIRYTTFIGTRNLLVNGSLVKAPTFNKFPGNPTLNNTAENRQLNMAKPFRLSEQYLISAEAAAMLNQTSDANDRLEAIRTNRISRYTYPTGGYSGTDLLKQIKLERQRELIGEGFRMCDLRRWGEGFNRTDASYMTFPQATEIILEASRSVVYQQNDHRYAWPIPSSELQVNPQMQGQQNPGYGN